jgi:hypothetical protein
MLHERDFLQWPQRLTQHPPAPLLQKKGAKSRKSFEINTNFAPLS